MDSRLRLVLKEMLLALLHPIRLYRRWLPSAPSIPCHASYTSIPVSTWTGRRSSSVLGKSLGSCRGLATGCSCSRSSSFVSSATSGSMTCSGMVPWCCVTSRGESCRCRHCHDRAHCHCPVEVTLSSLPTLPIRAAGPKRTSQCQALLQPQSFVRFLSLRLTWT